MEANAFSGRRWRSLDQRTLQLQVVQPGLIGLIDGTLSTLAPIFAAAYVRKRFQPVSWRTSLIQVTLGGIVIAAVGFVIGHA